MENGKFHKKSVKSINPCLTGRQARKSVIQTIYDIVKTHGGEIGVESKEGGGTEFIIKLLGEIKNEK